MKIVYFGVFLFFCIHRQSNGAVVRKPPAFSTPVYSDAYLPAAMQVIFHAVSQLKDLQIEELEETLASSTTTVKTDVDATSPHAPGQLQPIFQDPPTVATSPGASSGQDGSAASTASAEASPAPEAVPTSVGVSSSSPLVTSDSISTASTPIMVSAADPTQSSAINNESTNHASEIKAPGIKGTTELIEAETPEENYATPEINHELQEAVQEVQETVQEMVEKNQETIENDGDHVDSYPNDHIKESNAETSTALPDKGNKSDDDSSEESDKKKNSSEESDDKKDASDESDDKKNSSEESDDKKDSSDEWDDKKNSSGESDDKKNSSDESDDKKESSDESKEEHNDSRSLEESKQEKLDSSEEEDEEIRFTLIGEKVSQVPRPSLSNYLRKTAKSPLRNSTQELASLYDALSKDARRQGFAKYSGYSDEVLQTLKSSAEGGIGPQIRILLEKTSERKELTRDDAKSKLLSTLKNLRDPSTLLSRDLRRLIPLSYII